MKLLRSLFGSRPPADSAIHLYVRCERCGSLVHVRVDPRNELSVEYDDSDDPTGYRLVKEIMDSRCFRLMRAEITYDRGKRELERTITGGAFVSREEYEKQNPQ